MPRTQSVEALEVQYHHIAEIYDLAEELVEEVEATQPEYVQHQLYVVEPLIDQMGNSTDILCEEFIDVAGKQEVNPSKTNRIESALRKLFVAIDGYYERAEEMATSTGQAMNKMTHMIVEKVKRQIEMVIAIMVDYVDLALDRIMNKQHMEELRKRQEKIAHMLAVAERQSGFELGA